MSSIEYWDEVLKWQYRHSTYAEHQADQCLQYADIVLPLAVTEGYINFYTKVKL